MTPSHSNSGTNLWWEKKSEVKSPLEVGLVGEGLDEKEREGTFWSDSHALYLDTGLGDSCILGQNLANAHWRVVVLCVNLISKEN